MAAATMWAFALGGTDHVVTLGPDNPLKGWPNAFTCDGREYPIHIAFKRGRRFESPFSVGSHPAVLVMKQAARPAFWTRFKTALGGNVCGGTFASVEAVSALTPWQYELIVDGRSIDPAPVPE